MLFVLLAVRAQRARRSTGPRSAWPRPSALKSFPVLLLPVFLLTRPRAHRMRWALLATVAGRAVALPFAWHDRARVRRELFGYGGVADFGWIAVVRALRFLATGALARGEAAHWPGFVSRRSCVRGRVRALLVRWWRAPRAPDLPAMCLALLLAFLTLYGALSAQYLLWVGAARRAGCRRGRSPRTAR